MNERIIIIQIFGKLLNRCFLFFAERQKIVFLCILLSSQILAQPTLQFQNFTQKDGLSSTYVQSILQDHQGFMWIGTENGLNRFDGQHFLSFRSDPEDEETLNGNWIWTMFEDNEKRLWIGTEIGLNVMDLQTGKIQRVPLVENGKAIKSGHYINQIYESTDGTLWVVTWGNGLFQLKFKEEDQKWEGQYFSYDNDKAKSDENIHIKIVHSTNEELWVVHSEGVNRVNLENHNAISYFFPELEEYEKNGEERFATFDGKQTIYAGYQNKFFYLNIAAKKPELKQYTSLKDSSDLLLGTTKDLFFYDEETLLVPADRNLVLLRLTDRTTSTIRREGQIETESFIYGIHTVYQDKEGNLWVGTRGGGLSVGQTIKSPFKFYQNNASNPYSISTGSVRSFVENDEGKLWVGIYDRGLDQFIFKENGIGFKQKNISQITQGTDAFPSDKTIKIIQAEDQNIWVATNDSGLLKLDASGGFLEDFKYDPNDENSLSGNRIWGLTEDRDGYIWVGTWSKGLNRLNPNTGEIIRYSLSDPNDPSSAAYNHIKYLFVDNKNILWIGTDNGLVQYDIQKEEFTFFQQKLGDKQSLSANLIWAIYEDRNGDLWVGTNTGLNRFDAENQTFERFYEKDGLPDNSIYGILEDDEGFLWVSTQNGLARIISKESSTVAFRALGVEDGLKTTAFVPKAYLNSPNSDQLFFGSSDGMLTIRPSLLKEDTSNTQLVVSEVKRFKRSAIDKPIVSEYFLDQQEQKVKLSYQDQSITFAIADLNWLNHTTFKYEYQLFGFNKQWRPLDDNMQVSFSNLPAGNYTLKARAKNLDDNSLEATTLLQIKVSPPWWNSWWAYLGYLLIIGMLVLVWIRYYLARQLEKQEAENLKTLDAFKNKLFTNITHEFRTPLTIISGMTEQIKRNPKQWVEEGTDLVLKNTNNLLDLVNQILELQKVESGKLELKMQQGDILPFLKSIFQQFQAFGQSKEQTMTFSTKVESLIMDYDSEKTLRILSNLLSNAIKYAPENGAVDVAVSTSKKSERLIISVKDNGPGIPSEQLPYIFDRFFQASSKGKTGVAGTGVGLSLTQELVKLLDGTIEVESKLGEGTTFQVFLPIRRKAEAQIADEAIDVSKAVFSTNTTVNKSIKANAEQLPLALIVEDNPDIARYLQICLEGNYNIEYASNGQLGIDRALAIIPDIIISDVMMPEKNGFELCETLKEDVRTSHIPIILLTAKSDVQSRIVGLKQGADDYLAKPFHEEELFVRMQNLLNIRRQLQERYKDIYAQPLPKQEEKQASKEDEFILKLKDVFETKMDDPDFNLDALSKSLFLSRSQLGRKVKALTGKSPAIFIRSIRLQKAKQLLLTTNLSIKEVGYEVGIFDPAYFSKSYAEFYGEPPSKTGAA